MSYIAEPCLDGKLAKRAASFVACKVLRNIGALDDHLLPLHLFAKEDAKDEDGRTIGSRKRQIGYEKKRADAWTPEGPFAERTTLYGTLLHFDGPGGTMTFEKELYRPLMLLTRARLPATPKIKLFADGEAISASASPLPGSFFVSKQQRVTLRGWNLRVWLSVLNRMIDIDGEKMNYFVAPLKADCSLADCLGLESLDWSLMEHGARIQEDKLDWKDLSKLGDSVIVDAGKNDCEPSCSAIARSDANPSLLQVATFSTRRTTSFTPRAISLPEGRAMRDSPTSSTTVRLSFPSARHTKS